MLLFVFRFARCYRFCFSLLVTMFLKIFSLNQPKYFLHLLCKQLAQTEYKVKQYLRTPYSGVSSYTPTQIEMKVPKCRERKRKNAYIDTSSRFNIKTPTHSILICVHSVLTFVDTQFWPVCTLNFESATPMPLGLIWIRWLMPELDTCTKWWPLFNLFTKTTVLSAYSFPKTLEV